MALFILIAIYATGFALMALYDAMIGLPGTSDELEVYSYWFWPISAPMFLIEGAYNKLSSIKKKRRR